MQQTHQRSNSLTVRNKRWSLQRGLMVLLWVLLAVGLGWLSSCSSTPSNNQNNQNNQNNTSNTNTNPSNQNNANGNNNNENVAPACSMPKVPDVEVDTNATKFALTMFHYNIEYVVGGLSSSDRHKSFCGEQCEGWDNDKVEDWIVTDTFEPVVDFYLKHPKWKVNFEMQGYMLEVLANRFPQVLEKVRTLTGRGQMEISSFHYSDQLFLAYPKEDLVRSIQLTKDIFKKYCIPLSPVVFNQEGQAGEGRQKVLVEQGYKIGVFPKNLYRYVRGEDPPWPYYSQFGGHMIVGPIGLDPKAGIDVSWLFFDDGELLSVPNKLNPYFAPLTNYDPKTMDAYKLKIEDLEKKGYKIAHISEYVETLKAKKVEAKPAPILLDGTWQPKSTSSIHRWLGGQGLTLDERDNEVRSGNYIARTMMKAAELLYEDWKKTNGKDDAIEAKIQDGWIKVFRSQISDASGVNPWAAEIFWGLDLNEAIMKLTDELFKDLKAKRKANFVRIDLKDGKITNLDKMPEAETLEKATMPLKGFEVEAEGRTSSFEVLRVEANKEHYRVEIKFGKGTKEAGHRTLIARFPRTFERIVYSPGLMEDTLVDYALSEFQFQTGEVYLPLPNGIIGLGDDWYVIKHVTQNHLTARVDAGKPIIEFIDRTQHFNKEAMWKFDLFKGSKEDALALANRLNIHPVVVK
ncbi:MAG: hypothetical protein EP343_28375 [Deltaproteobacteria bacterium]|nr:MAG: hypothetical protein EP343_28375 [Deltaproteobacteria bacterium]